MQSTNTQDLEFGALTRIRTLKLNAFVARHPSTGLRALCRDTVERLQSASRRHLALHVGLEPTRLRVKTVLLGPLCIMQHKLEEGKGIEPLQPLGHRRVQTG